MTPTTDGGDGGSPTRKSREGLAGAGAQPPPELDETTGVPGLRSWRAVYLVVLALFVVWVGLLTALSWRFS